MTDVSQQVAYFFESHPVTHLGKGQTFLRPDDIVTKIHYLVSGMVIQYDIATNGNTIVVNAFKPGAFFPLSSVMNNKKSEYFFEASSEVTMRVAPAKLVLDWLDDNPVILRDVLARVYSGTDGLLRRMSLLMSGSALARVVFELSNAAYRFGHTNRDGSIYIPLNEDDIAKRCGLSRETVSRTMQKLKKNFGIAIRDNGFIVPDIEQLVEVINS